MIIIVDGLDGVGKSTIIQGLSKMGKFDLYVSHFKENRNAFNIRDKIPYDQDVGNWNYFIAGMNFAILEAISNFDNFILDRFHLSEYAFSRFYNRNSIVSFEDIDKYLLKMKKEVKLILCTIGYDVYVKRFSKRKNERNVLDSDGFIRQNRDFIEGFDKSQLSKITIDSSKTLKYSISQLEKFINE